ncbi:MAG TPA: hypothetical protein DCG24_03910 [Bacteroidetes bacterium]|nr:hypothetical protein [Bacteroidota bacterium]HAE34654.1 hypothetical protein [Bacteroidota bacterium]HQU75048.1 hypothetical protein [Chitinophagales bacterium]
MKIFEVLWLAASLIALTMAIIRATSGQAYGNYIYITLFTAAVALFMYRFKKRNRLYLEEREKEHIRQQEELQKKHE